MQINPSETEIEESINRNSKAGPFLLSVSHELIADLETPVSSFYKICDKKSYSFLLESVEGGEKIGRYSIIGCDPILIFSNKNGKSYLENTIDKKSQILEDNPFDALKSVLNKITVIECCNNNFLGFIGYLGYENIRWIEPKISLKPFEKLPDVCLTLPGKLIVFDHILHRVNLIVNILSNKKEDILPSITKAKEKLNSFIEEFSKPITHKPLLINYKNELSVPYKSNYSKDEFSANVKKAKEYIVNGDIFQVVLSQKLTIEKRFDGFLLYRALRSINPSPYLFYLNFLGYEIAGSSPEVMVKCEQVKDKKLASLRPIAGTYSRKTNKEEDLQNAKKLLNDPKEKAEHLMLVDLARNDLGRVCKTGTINTPELMVIEKYSHVLHIVSQVEGILENSQTSIDLLKACFPAGTLSGAPKIRAMEIINELEKDHRGTYGGCTGFFGLNDTINTCMTIRTFVIYKDHIEIQVGAGIVADSDPQSEYEETLRKGAALLKAISLLQ